MPRLALVLFVHKMLRQQAVEIADAVVIPLREVAVFRPNRADSQIIHNDLLSGINADLVLPAGAHMGAVHHDFNLLGRPGVGPVRACKAFDAEHLAAYAFPAALAHLLGKMAAFINEGH